MNNTSNETEYNKACEKANVAYEVFALIRQSYRAGLTDDDTFLAAKAVYAKAQAEYDKAFAAASDVKTSEVRWDTHKPRRSCRNCRKQPKSVTATISAAVA